MTEVAIGEGIGTILQPHNKRMYLAEGPNAWVMDVKIYNKASNGKAEGGIDRV